MRAGTRPVKARKAANRRICIASVFRRYRVGAVLEAPRPLVSGKPPLVGEARLVVMTAPGGNAESLRGGLAEGLTRVVLPVTGPEHRLAGVMC